MASPLQLVWNTFINNLDYAGSGSSPPSNITLTPDTGSPLSGTSFALKGQRAGNVSVVDTLTSAGVFLTEDRTWKTQYVVDPSTTPGTRGTFSTIQAALNQAVSDGMTYTNQKVILIRTASITENLTIPGGAILVGENLGNPFGGITTPTQNTTIVGHHTFTGTVVWGANGINFEVSGSNDLFNGGSAAVVLGYLRNCTLLQAGSAKLINSMPSNSTMNMTDSYLYFGAGGTQVDTTNMNSMTLANCIFDLQGDFVLGGPTLLNFLNCQGSTEESGCGVILSGTGGFLFAQKTSFATQDAYNISGSGGQGFISDCSFYGPTTAAVQSTVGPMNYKNCSLISPTGFPLFETGTVVQQDQILQGNVIPSTLTATDLTMSGFMYYVGVTDTSVARTINLPDSTTSPPPAKDQIFIVKDESLAAGTNNITVTTNSGTPLIEGNASVVISSNGGSITVRFDGTNYFLLNEIAGVGGITTLTGDSGSATGATVTLHTGLLSGRTVQFVNSGSTSTLQVTDGDDNTIIGGNAGHSGLSGSGNSSFGSLSLGSIQSGSQNTSGGRATNYFLTTGSNNTCYGYSACESLVSGDDNIVIGSGAGGAYNGAESNNILIGSEGVQGESGVTRIGTQNNQTECFIAGITGNTVAGGVVTVDHTTGQLGEGPAPFSPQASIPNVGATVASLQSAVLIPYIGGSPDGPFAGTINLNTANLFLVPVYVDKATTYTKIGVRVTNTPGAGSTLDLVLYDSTGTGGLPGAVVASAVNIDSSVGGVLEGTISALLQVGYYWLAIQDNSAQTVTIQAAGNGDGFSFITNRAFLNLSTIPSSFINTFSYFEALNTYGTYLSNPTITGNQPQNAVPILYLR